MPEKKGAYAQAGVDFDVAISAKESIKRLAARTNNPGVLKGIGFFGSLFDMKGWKDAAIVSHVDGVGTKLRVAILMKKNDTIGMDIVNHCINDIFTCGATPLFFLDYIGMGKLVQKQIEDIVSGLTAACEENGCALVGGETAEMPGIYGPGDYDLVGFIVGAVEKKNVIDGRTITDGDLILGLPSSGVHTNGYSLVRQVFDIDKTPTVLTKHYSGIGRTLGEELLEPHRCYYPVLKSLLPKVKGLAHITGGAFKKNIPRVVPEGLTAHLDKSSWRVPPIFRLIQKTGDIDEAEMYRVFNMGIGMAVFCSPQNAPSLLKKLPDAVTIGRVSTTQGDEPRVILS
jgi:phosphoribosylformylglycinamidine cyclo-ligase